MKDTFVDLFRVLQRMFSPIICSGRIFMDLIPNWGGESHFDNQLAPK